SGMRQVFRKQPENGTSVEGEGTLIECEVEAVSGQVQWVRDGLLLGPGRSLPGFPRYSVIGNSLAGVFNLQIDNVQLEDDASFQCQVGQSELSLGIISRTAWLEVLIPPKIPIIQEVATGTAPTWVAGEGYSLTCHVEDSKPAASIVFTKSGLELTRSETTVNPGSKPKLFSTMSVIRVTPESTDNGKDILCAAWNPALSQPRTTSFRMNVLYPPEMPKIEGLSQRQVKAGVTLQLVCTSTGGNPLAMLQWLKGDEVLSKSWETDDATRSSRSLLSYSTKPQDDGVKLTCEALNQVTAKPLRAVIILHVVYAPTRVVISGQSRAAEGKDISLSCSTSSSSPPAVIRWWASGKELNVTEVTYSRTSLGVSTISNVTLTTSRQDNGIIIVCEAVNEAVFMTRSASIVLKVHCEYERPEARVKAHRKQARGQSQSSLCGGPRPESKFTVRRPEARVKVHCAEARGQSQSSLCGGPRPESKFTVRRPEARVKVHCAEARGQSQSSLCGGPRPESKFTVRRPEASVKVHCAEARGQCQSSLYGGPRPESKFTVRRPEARVKIHCAEARGQGQSSLCGGPRPGSKFTAEARGQGQSSLCGGLRPGSKLTVSRPQARVKAHREQARGQNPPERIWILGPPQSARFHTGAQVTLSCFVSGGNPPARLTWTKGRNSTLHYFGSIIQSSTGSAAKGSKPVSRGVYKSTGKLASSELTITTVPSDNQVNYKCSASNEATINPLTAVIRVWVQFAPIDMKMTSSAETVHQGEIITLTCHIGSSNPVPQVAWIKDGVRLPAADVRVQDSDYGGQAVTAEMSLVAKSTDHGKRVLCEAYSPVLEEALNTFHQLDIL
ncbi:nephrin-like, partial [Carcharodon carcharias]|uniref:nephrin-like n=1 Tax=Carcharodon carcharias TaxID=13397 RepID=UPI001B7E29B5